LDRGLPRNSSNVELTPEGQQAKQKLVTFLQDNATLSWPVQSKGKGIDLLSLSFTHADPNLAKMIPNALVKNYIERTSATITRRLTESRDFLKKQVEACEGRLKNLDTERIDFEKEHAKVMPENAGAAQSRIDGIKADMTRLTRERIKASHKIEKTRLKIAQLNQSFPHAIDQLKKDWPQETKDEMDRILGVKLGDNATSRSASQPANMASQDSPAGPTSDPHGSFAMSGAMADYRMVSQEWELLQSEYADLKAKYNEMTELMSDFYVVRERYDDILDKVAKEQRELNAWQDKFNTIQMELSAEVANRRTHMNTVQAAQVKFLPDAPELLRIMAAALCVALLAIHWAISPLVTLGQRTIAVVWVSLVSLAVIMMTVHPAVLGVSACVVISAWLAVRLDRWWSRSRAGRVVVVLLTIVIVCAAIAAMNSILLKLQYPDMFAECKQAPLTFLYEQWLMPAVYWVMDLFL